jgi:hypothetical protein
MSQLMLKALAGHAKRLALWTIPLKACDTFPLPPPIHLPGAMNSPRGAAFSANTLCLTHFSAVLAIGNGGRLRHTTCRVNRRYSNTSNSVSSGVSGVKGFKLQRLGTFVGFGAGMRRGPGKTLYREQVLHGRRKGDPQKVRIAARLRRETTLALEWAANRLCMGAPTHVASLPQCRNQEGRNSEESLF